MKKIAVAILAMCSMCHAANGNAEKTIELSNKAELLDGEEKDNVLIQVIQSGMRSLNSEQARKCTRQAFDVLLSSTRSTDELHVLKLGKIDFLKRSIPFIKDVNKKRKIQTEIRVMIYKKTLELNSENSVIRFALIKILVVEMDSPQEAKQYLPDKVPLVWKNLEILKKDDTASLISLGKWYEKLAKQSKCAKDKMLNRSLSYYSKAESEIDVQRVKNAIWVLTHDGPSPNQVFEFKGRLSSGLVIREYAITREQNDGKKVVDISTFGKPLMSKYHKTNTLSAWRHTNGKNAIAYGYLRIPKSGEYAFKHSGFYHFCALFVNGVRVPPGDVVTRLHLKKGYVRIASVQYAHGRIEDVSIKWVCTTEQESDINSKYLFHSADDRKVKFPLVKKKQ